MFFGAILVIAIVLGVVDGMSKVRMVKTGQIRGVKPSKTFFDWMFYNYDK